MKLDYSDPKRWAALVNGLIYYRAIRQGVEGLSDKALSHFDEMIAELDPDRHF